MFLLQKATQVTAAAPVPESPGHDDAALTEWLAGQYAPAGPRPAERPRVRVNFVASIDGSATAAGRSGGLAGDGDRLLFGVLRSLADVILVGASTAVTEGYRVPKPNRRGDTPLLILASRSLDIPPDYDTVTRPGVVVATCTSAPADRRERLTAAGATLLDCGSDIVEMRRLLGELGDRGHDDVLCEGGPRLFADLLAENVVDELALTLSPRLVGGDGPRIAHGTAVPGAPLGATCRHLIGDDEGFLYFLWDCAHPGR
ncbi:MAG: dihydrofolate reductase family protein [Gordonia sp. (in: high G+C Gram-positive bacteria)]|uniref:dihydrofolate reductase family protein n=1 Tax=Gordonia sp. (in: high G+C Gram-positive bacteria) TaxID=84139 RepID=UPI0039E3E46A